MRTIIYIWAKRLIILFVVILNIQFIFADIPGYLNPIDAGVFQISPDAIQFWMELSEPIPHNPNPDHHITYIWFVDTDNNPSTGQNHESVGSEYNIRAVIRNHIDDGQGFIDGINSRPSGEIPLFVSGNKVYVRLILPQIGSPEQFRWNYATFSSDNPGSFHSTLNTFTPSAIPPQDTQPVRVIITPFLSFRNGVFSISPNVYAYNHKGQALSLTGRNLYSYRDVVQVNGKTLQVTGGKAGLDRISAMVDGVVSSNVSLAMVGSVELSPALIHLQLDKNPTGKVSLIACDANGIKIPLENHILKLTNDNKDVVTLSPDGTLQGLSTGKGKQTYISGEFDGSHTTNRCAVRVLNKSAPLLKEQEARGSYVSFWYPLISKTPIPAGCRFEQMVREYDYIHSLDVAYLRMMELTGSQSAEGGMQFISAVCEDDTYKLCGGSGNPVGLGFNPWKPSSSAQLDNGVPHWGVVLHEIGHDFLGSFHSLDKILFRNTLPSGWIYSEGLATLCNMYSRQMIVAQSDHYGVPTKVINSWLDPNIYDSLPFHRQVFVTKALTTYVREGANYPSKCTPDVLDGIFIVLAEKFGWQIYPRFFSIFWSPDEPINFTPTNETQRSTFFISAMSASARTDLRSLFVSWGFPCDNELFVRLLPMLQSRAEQRR